MKGAVLHKLGVDLVRTRMIKASYGTENLVSFQEGHHPESRKVLGYDGRLRCEGVMYWFAKKVSSQFVSAEIFRASLLRTELFYTKHSTLIIRKEQTIAQTHIFLWTDFGYATKTRLRNIWTHKVSPSLTGLILVMKMHINLTVDLGKLPPDAWERKEGVRGTYRRVQYELGLSFGAGGIEWRFLYKGKVMGSVKCEYV